MKLTAPNTIGSVVIAAIVKNNTMTMFGLLGSALKIWWISGNLPYLKGFSPCVGGALGSSAMAKENAGELYPVDEPKEPITMEAESEEELRRNWVGRSFCVWDMC